MTSQVTVHVSGRAETLTFGPEDAPVPIGRDARAGILLEHSLVSRLHAHLVHGVDSGWVLQDLGSRNGTWSGGRRVNRVPVRGSVDVQLGDDVSGARLRLSATAPRQRLGEHDVNEGTGARVIGRDPEAWCAVDDPLASWHHARLEADAAGEWFVVDTGSTNGTVVDDEELRGGRRRLRGGERLLVGGTRLRFHDGLLEPETDGGFVVDRAVLALGDGRRIVDEVSLEIPEPSLVAVIGPSGAGKSSLMRMMTGQLPPSQGAVMLHGASMTSQRRANRGQIGVVPQHTVAHHSLTARQALDYTARLRLADDIGPSERRRVVDEALRRLGMEQHVDTRIGRLSGGQQRRVGIAMEMLTDPDLLILDEPTAGLDPSLVLQIMRVLRGLADSGKMVLLVTHDLEHLDQVDRVLVLRAGGTVAYFGPPSGIFAAFHASSWAETFEQLGQPAPDRHDRPVLAAPARQSTELPVHRSSVQTFVRQVAVVVRRQVRLIGADPLYLGLLVGMPLVLGVLSLAVPGRDGLSRATDPHSVQAQLLLVLMVVGAAFLGLSSSIRDLVSEVGIYRHEREAGLAPAAYLVAKTCLFASLASLQATLLAGLVMAFRRHPDHPLVVGSGAAEVAAAMVATAICGVALGLAVSSYVATTEQSMPPLVLLVMGQIVLCGGLFPIDGRGLLPAAAWPFPTRWGYAAAASSVDLNAVSPAIDPDPLWTHDASNWWGCLVLLAVLSFVFLLVAMRGVSRRRTTL